MKAVCVYSGPVAEGNVRTQDRCETLAWVEMLLCVAAFMHLAGCGPAPAPTTATSEARESSRSRTSSSSAAYTAGGRYDLERDEERGGHTLDRHVGRTDEELRERLRRERNISAASTWTDRETAEVTVAQALRAERGRIERWTRRGYPRANMALHYDAGRTIGRSLRRGEEQALDCTSAVIVLRADGPESYYVLTTYPEESK